MTSSSYTPSFADAAKSIKSGASVAEFERLEKESAKAYQAFVAYRDLPVGERSLTTVSQQLKKSRSLCARWSTQFCWIGRARAWDTEQDRQRRSRLAEEREKIYERQLQQNKIAAQALTAPLLALAKRVQNNADTYAKVSTEVLTKLVALSARALPGIHANERQVAAPAEDVIQKEQPLKITRAEFTWVQSRCTCGHPWDTHVQEPPLSEVSIAPITHCKVAGCGCTKFIDDEDND